MYNTLINVGATVRLDTALATELLRENKRLIDRSIREIDRERNSLQLQESKLIMEMKKNAKNGQMVRQFTVDGQHPSNFTFLAVFMLRIMNLWEQ